MKYGRVLEINLNTKSFRKYQLEDDLINSYIGGSGIAARLLYDMTDVNTDPLGPDNVLIFASGVFSGTAVPSSGRHAVVAKSPLTGIYGEADAGGYWGTMLRKAGYDVLVIKGCSEKPVYIWINNGDVEVRDACHLWGKDTFETDRLIKAETNNNSVTATIGVAGENLALIASIIHDGQDARAAARCGLGAVMGSKKLKSIAVYGEMDISVFDKEGLRKNISSLSKMIRENNLGNTEYGTAGYTEMSETIGDLPVKNWQQRTWKDVSMVGGDVLKQLNKKSFACGSCFVRCGRVVKSYFEEGVNTSGPEYETVGILGANCFVNDINKICRGNEICNRYGIDTISAGSIVAFAMELYQRGIITDDMIYPLNWGDGDAMCRLLEDMGNGVEGLPKVLSNGVKKAAEIIGCGAEKYAIHSKGLEFPAHDPRAMTSGMVGYATSNRGACHLQAFSHSYETGLTEPSLGVNGDYDRHSDNNKAKLVAVTQDLMCLYDSLKVCKFMTFGGVKVEHLLNWYQLVTGNNITLDEFMEKGRNIFMVKRLYNQRLGISRKDENIPERIKKEKLSGGAVNFEKMLNEYYDVRGFNRDGKIINADIYIKRNDA